MKSLLLVFFLLLCPLFAGEQEEAEKVLRKYQEKLAMQSWNITVTVTDSNTIHEATHVRESMASSSWNYFEHTGKIFIMRRDQYTKEFIAMYNANTPDKYKVKNRRKFAIKDQRNSIVHELVHVVMDMPNEFAVQLLTETIDP